MTDPSPDNSKKGRPAAPLFHVTLKQRCPRCGQGPLFNGFLTMASGCPNCGLGYEGHDSGDGPAYLVSFVLSIVVVVAALMVELAYTPPLWVHALIWPVLVLGGSLSTLRPVKALMVALQYRYRDVETIHKSGQH